MTNRVDADHFAALYDGLIETPAGGTYTFTTTSDDGSRLYIDGTMIIDNDGLHGPFAVAGNVDMATGFHAIRVEFFENEGGATLFVDRAGPGIANQSVPASVLFHRLTA